ncbi:MAG: hypothetical protein M3Y28_02205 [Armatimonadota bacterium]|nr:hypothetical protein [Armatimonadota bacterium]
MTKAGGSPQHVFDRHIGQFQGDFVQGREPNLHVQRLADGGPYGRDKPHCISVLNIDADSGFRDVLYVRLG